LKISAVCQTKFGEPKFPISWQKCQYVGRWDAPLLALSPVFIVYLKVGRSILVNKYENWVVESIISHHFNVYQDYFKNVIMIWWQYEIRSILSSALNIY